MKRIYLIGDSIRLGYDSRVRELLAGEAILYWSMDNARYVNYTLRCLHEWAGADCDPEKVDLVHWNNGLWDVLHVLGDPLPQTTPDVYRQGLTRIIGRIRKVFPNAKIVFATTTSVIEERLKPSFYRKNSEIEQYNAIAREVMAENGVEIDDLYPVARNMSDDWHAEDGVHYTPEGYQALAESVAARLRELLYRVK